MTLSATPPAGTPLPERHPAAPAPGTDLPPHYRHCFGCGNEHPTGLHLRVRTGAGLRIEGEFTVGGEHQGAAGLAHGGLLATAFDETLGYLMWLIGQPAVTGRLEVDYRRPVPVGTTLRIAAEVTGAAGRKIYTRATGAVDGQVAVEARGLFVTVAFEHFTTHGAADQELPDELVEPHRVRNPYNP
ncbi:MAG TPA: PaaI family thioesterase [Mycobacteriales bacterium]|nr:PaaI family thioesterase [Mycobacteriales bacterium]